MTHEEIEVYLKSRDLDAMQYQLVMDAMDYAENTVIEKSCKWFNEVFSDTSHNSGRGFFCKIETGDFDCMEDMIEQFKKAMKKAAD